MTPTESPQAFWLAKLGAAAGFNGWVFSHLEPYLGKRVLEVGCGTGNFTTLLAGSAQSVLAVDLDPAFTETARQRTQGLSNVEIRCADVVKDALPDGFDTVVMLDVLEHLEDDVAILAKLRERVGEGGRIVLKVPALPWLFNSMDRAVGHFRRYGRPGLRRAIVAAGLTPLRVWPFNYAAIPGWWFNGTVLRRTHPPAHQVRQFDRLVAFLAPLERWVPLPFGLSYFAVCERRDPPQSGGVS